MHMHARLYNIATGLADDVHVHDTSTKSVTYYWSDTLTKTVDSIKTTDNKCLHACMHVCITKQNNRTCMHVMHDMMNMHSTV